MKSFRGLVLILTGVFFWGEPIVSADEAVEKVRILGIGNSFTVNATRFLPQILAADPAVDMDIAYAQIPASSLAQHVQVAHAHEVNAEDPDGTVHEYWINGRIRSRGGMGLREILQDGKWDYVSLQQVSHLSWQPETFQPYARQLYAYVRKHQPKAKIVLHETWAYEVDHWRLRRWNLTQQQMYDKIHAAYAATARDLGVEVIPAGTAMQNARKLPLWQYKPPVDFDPSKAVFPEALPDTSSSLCVIYRWGHDPNDKKKRIVNYDGFHANVAGEYLLGLVWYEFFTGRDCPQIAFKPDNLSQERADSLKDVAHQTVSPVAGGLSSPDNPGGHENRGL